jgi:hypothetical protein
VRDFDSDLGINIRPISEQIPMDWLRLIRIVLQELEEASEEKSCIIATAVLLEVLNSKRVKGAYPLVVKYKILNPQFTKRLKKEGFPQAPEQIARWQADGCAMVAITNVTAARNDWPGHLVAVIPNGLNGRDAICDLTITQANVPPWKIILRPICMGVRSSFLEGSEDFGLTMNDCQIIYRAFPDNRSFRETPLWKNKLGRHSIVKRVLERLNEGHAS